MPPSQPVTVEGLTVRHPLDRWSGLRPGMPSLQRQLWQRIVRLPQQRGDPAIGRRFRCIVSHPDVDHSIALSPRPFPDNLTEMRQAGCTRDQALGEKRSPLPQAGVLHWVARSDEPWIHHPRTACATRSLWKSVPRRIFPLEVGVGRSSMPARQLYQEPRSALPEAVAGTGLRRTVCTCHEGTEARMALRCTLALLAGAACPSVAGVVHAQEVRWVRPDLATALRTGALLPLHKDYELTGLPYLDGIVQFIRDESARLGAECLARSGTFLAIRDRLDIEARNWALRRQYGWIGGRPETLLDAPHEARVAQSAWIAGNTDARGLVAATAGGCGESGFEQLLDHMWRAVHEPHDGTGMLVMQMESPIIAAWPIALPPGLSSEDSAAVARELDVAERDGHRLFRCEYRLGDRVNTYFGWSVRIPGETLHAEQVLPILPIAISRCPRTEAGMGSAFRAMAHPPNPDGQVARFDPTRQTFHSILDSRPEVEFDAWEHAALPVHVERLAASGQQVLECPWPDERIRAMGQGVSAKYWKDSLPMLDYARLSADRKREQSWMPDGYYLGPGRYVTFARYLEGLTGIVPVALRECPQAMHPTSLRSWFASTRN